MRHATRVPNRLIGVCIDCADAGPVARFYERVLAFDVIDFDPPTWAQLADPVSGLHLNIQGESWYEPPTWPERPGEQTKMLHLEIEVDDVEAAVALAESEGATQAAPQPTDRDTSRTRIMLDPAGHPFCFFLPGE